MSSEIGSSLPIAEPAGRPRVLIEHADERVAEILGNRLAAWGYEAVICTGPEHVEGMPSTCPVLRQERCELAEQADVVVSGLDFKTRNERVIVRRLRRWSPERPMILAGKGFEVRQLANALGLDHDGMRRPSSIIDRVSRLFGSDA